MLTMRSKDMNQTLKIIRERGIHMKRSIVFVTILVLLFAGNANATFVSGSTGAGGAFNPTANITVTVPANGIFNYTTVNIPAGVTVTFNKNDANTPVYILATGDVTIAGTIKVDGVSVTSSNPVSTSPGRGGPGAYDGGYGGATALPGGKGLGPGGGGGGPSSTYIYGGGGGFGTAGGSYGANYGAGGSAYGNASIVPLIGGSGGGGGAGTTSASQYGGGGGGGAILIASSTTITVNGSLTANGGDGYSYSGGGSGGAIRLIANTISGTGTISAKGGSISSGTGKGGQGRIRIEASANNFTPVTDPPYTYGQTGGVFLTNTPALMVTSVAGVNTPATPTGSYSTPDILLPNTTTNPVSVGLSASNIPVGTTVTVSVIPQLGSATNVTTSLSGSNASSTATASVTLSTSYSNVITAQATFTPLLAMYWDGEKIAKVRVAATMGKDSETVYITESGKEIPAKELKLAGLLK